jgi:hypothetical protein
VRTWRLESCELGGCNCASEEIHWEAVASEFSDALGGRDRANLQAVIEQFWRYTWWPYSMGFGDALGRCNQASLELHLEAVIE